MSYGQQQSYNYDPSTNQQYANYLNAFNQYSQQALSAAAGYGATAGTTAPTTNYGTAPITAAAPGMSSANSVPLGGSAAAASSTSSGSANYKSYEQAVIEHAKLLQVQQAKEKIFGVPTPKKTYGSERERKPYNAGQFYKKPKINKEPIDPRKYFCDVCNVTCAGDKSFAEHKLGKSHKHKEAQKTGKIRLDLNRPGYHCEVCNATCSSKEAFSAHISGQKHNRAIKTLQMLGKPVPEYLTLNQPKGDPMSNLPVLKKVVGVSATKFVGGMKLSTTHGDEEAAEQVNNTDDTFPPIGEEFLEVVPSSGKKTAYRCKLCECNCGDPASRDLHVRGRRHRLAYKQKIDASIAVEEKQLPRLPLRPGEFRKRSAQRAPAAPPRPLFQASFHTASTLPDTANDDLYDEQFVHTRLEQLEPTEQFVDKVESLVELIERSLKKVSDLLVEPTEDESDTRLLRGVVRVGPLGEHLLLKFDKQVTVVLLCKEIPTVTLLQRIVAEFPKVVDDEEMREKLVLETIADDSAFAVRFNDFDLKCLVTLTSVALRVTTNENGDKNDNDASAAIQPPKAVVKPADALPEEPCLRALAALRHTKFFQAQCTSLRHLSEIVKLLRDVCHRIDTWSVLSLYVLQLLAFKALSSHPAPLRISAGLRRFFEMLAGGVFMMSYSKLMDPCEKEEVNALKGISAQQRENLVCSAQHGLRLISYNQIYTILGMTRESINRKRPTESGDAEIEAKKPNLNAVVDHQSKPQ